MQTKGVPVGMRFHSIAHRDGDIGSQFQLSSRRLYVVLCCMDLLAIIELIVEIVILKLLN